MKTTMITTEPEYVDVEWRESVGILITEMSGNKVDYTRKEAIQLRNFLNQLELGD